MSNQDFDLNDILGEFQDYSPDGSGREPEEPRYGEPDYDRDPYREAPEEEDDYEETGEEAPLSEEDAETYEEDAEPYGEAAEARKSRKPWSDLKAPDFDALLKKAESGLKVAGAGLKKAGSGLESGWDKLQEGGKQASFRLRRLREEQEEGKGPAWLPKLLTAVLLLISFLCLLWIVNNVHPGSGTVVRGKPRAELASRITAEEEPVQAEPDQASPAPLKKHYVIDENAVVAPAPNPACFGNVSIKEPEKMMEVIQKARDYGLLREDETVVFDPKVDFYYDEDIEYYLDETILVICWKEVIEGNTCSFVEVKLADASQFRRKFADDTFASASQYYSTEMHKSTNAVVTLNADFYQNRDFGVVVYGRKLYRFPTSTYTGDYKKYNCLETCFVDTKGDFLFTALGQTFTQEELEQYIADNDILFSMSFGPVLVRDGEVLQCDWYPVGEINRGYSRAGIGQVDELHYLYMSLNHSPEKEARWTVNEFAQHFGEKPVRNAYCLDGGQTGEIVFQGRAYNHVDVVNGQKERPVSDNIYFATAIGGTEVSG